MPELARAEQSVVHEDDGVVPLRITRHSPGKHLPGILDAAWSVLCAKMRRRERKRIQKYNAESQSASALNNTIFKPKPQREILKIDEENKILVSTNS